MSHHLKKKLIIIILITFNQTTSASQLKPKSEADFAREITASHAIKTDLKSIEEETAQEIKKLTDRLTYIRHMARYAEQETGYTTNVSTILAAYKNGKDLRTLAVDTALAFIIEHEQKTKPTKWADEPVVTLNAALVFDLVKQAPQAPFTQTIGRLAASPEHYEHTFELFESALSRGHIQPVDIYHNHCIRADRLNNKTKFGDLWHSANPLPNEEELLAFKNQFFQRYRPLYNYLQQVTVHTLTPELFTEVPFTSQETKTYAAALLTKADLRDRSQASIRWLNLLIAYKLDRSPETVNRIIAILECLNDGYSFQDPHRRRYFGAVLENALADHPLSSEAARQLLDTLLYQVDTPLYAACHASITKLAQNNNLNNNPPKYGKQYFKKRAAYTDWINGQHLLKRLCKQIYTPTLRLECIEAINTILISNKHDTSDVLVELS